MSKLFRKNRLISTSCLIAALAASPFYALPSFAAGGQSYASIQTPGQSAKTRKVTLLFGKSTIIELPQKMKDVIVANPDLVESVIHTSHRVMMVGTNVGQTNAYIYGHNGEELLNLEISVERDVNGLNDLLERHIPGNEIEVTSIASNILLSGPVADATTASRVMQLAELWASEDVEGGNSEVVDQMVIQGREQVMLKVRIVEMQRSITKQMGINLSAVGQLGDSTVSLLSGGSVFGGSGFQGSYDFINSGGGDLQSLGGALAAMERVGLVRTKAEPTLTAISGETATFSAGGEFPVLTDTSIDVQTGQVNRQFTFKTFGVELGFTPEVLSEGRILLDIDTEVSEPTTEGSFDTGVAGGNVLAIRSRKASTVVELPAGGSLVIAGLIREEARQAVDGTPGLKDVPGVGALFRSRDDSNTQTELVVMVTPYLVDPVHPDKLKTPLDGFIPAGDREALLLGRLNKVYSNPGASTSGRQIQGPFGHAVD